MKWDIGSIWREMGKWEWGIGDGEGGEGGEDGEGG